MKQNRVLAHIAPILLLGFASACATQTVALDPITESSVVSNDATAMVQGCGANPAVGVAYCRIVEGDTTDDQVFFIAPPASCKRDACAYIKVWDNQGTLVYGGPIPKGQTRLGVAWRTLLSQGGKSGKSSVTSNLANVTPPAPDTFDITMRGFWSWNLQVYYIGKDGRERVSTAQGDIILRVYKTGYVPLQEVSSDPNYVWAWSDTFDAPGFGGILKRKFHFRMTSGLRAYVGVSDKD